MYNELTTVELYRKRVELAYEMSRVGEEIERRRQPKKFITKAEDLHWTSSRDVLGISGKEPFKHALTVCQEQGFDVHNFMAFMIQVPPHSEEGAYHTHGEAVKFYLSGRAKEIIDGEVYDVKAGDTAFIPANVWHGTQNPYDEPVKIFAVGDSPGSNLQSLAFWRPRKDLYVSSTESS